jgi:hypothetical protein
LFAFLLGLSRLVWLFGKGHHAIVLENLALRQQLSIYKRRPKRPRLAGRDRWFWIARSVVWKDWRRALCVVHPDTVVRWQRERFRRYWAHLSERSERLGRPPVSHEVCTLIRTLENPLLPLRRNDDFRYFAEDFFSIDMGFCNPPLFLCRSDKRLRAGTGCRIHETGHDL